MRAGMHPTEACEQVCDLTILCNMEMFTQRYITLAQHLLNCSIYLRYIYRHWFRPLARVFIDTMTLSTQVIRTVAARVGRASMFFVGIVALDTQGRYGGAGSFDTWTDDITREVVNGMRWRL